MKAIYITCGLLITLSCKSGLNDTDFKNNLETLDKINSKLLTIDNLDTLNKENSLTIIKGILKEDTLDFKNLTTDLKLKGIKYYEIGGIEYKFGTGIKYDYEYYMIYSINQNTKEKYLDYPQYLDFKIKKVAFNNKWTFIKIKESN